MIVRVPGVLECVTPARSVDVRWLYAVECAPVDAMMAFLLSGAVAALQDMLSVITSTTDVFLTFMPFFFWTH